MNAVDLNAEAMRMTARLRAGSWRRFLSMRGWGGGIQDCTDGCVRVEFSEAEREFMVVLSRPGRPDVGVCRLGRLPFPADAELGRKLALSRVDEPVLFVPPLRGQTEAALRCLVSEVREMRSMLRQSGHHADERERVVQQLTSTFERLDSLLLHLEPAVLDALLRGSLPSSTPPAPPDGSSTDNPPEAAHGT